MAKKIIQDGNPTLRATAKAVCADEFGTNKLSQTVQEMFDALYTQDDGVALAAPQIGISQRIFVINETLPGNHDDIPTDTPTVYINPEIISISKDKKKMSEGCLSVRPLYGKVKRATRMKIAAQKLNGEKFEVDAKGFLAQIFQHENDHLNGVLFIDTATDVYELEMSNDKNND